mmetsp:Transcript_24942/g.39444  ORF Transcript_24942/g.39444 Transcript_24942/m.39444 type:complete len:441 (+) Transcript_24942:380-1702(+)
MDVREGDPARVERLQQPAVGEPLRRALAEQAGLRERQGVELPVAPAAAHVAGRPGKVQILGGELDPGPVAVVVGVRGQEQRVCRRCFRAGPRAEGTGRAADLQQEPLQGSVLLVVGTLEAPVFLSINCSIDEQHVFIQVQVSSINILQHFDKVKLIQVIVNFTVTHFINRGDINVLAYKLSVVHIKPVAVGRPPDQREHPQHSVHCPLHGRRDAVPLPTAPDGQGAPRPQSRPRVDRAVPGAAQQEVQAVVQHTVDAIVRLGKAAGAQGVLLRVAPRDGHLARGAAADLTPAPHRPGRPVVRVVAVGQQPRGVARAAPAARELGHPAPGGLAVGRRRRGLLRRGHLVHPGQGEVGPEAVEAGARAARGEAGPQQRARQHRRPPDRVRAPLRRVRHEVPVGQRNGRVDQLQHTLHGLRDSEVTGEEPRLGVPGGVDVPRQR